MQRAGGGAGAGPLCNTAEALGFAEPCSLVVWCSTSFLCQLHICFLIFMSEVNTGSAVGTKVFLSTVVTGPLRRPL